MSLTKSSPRLRLTQIRAGRNRRGAGRVSRECWASVLGAHELYPPHQMAPSLPPGGQCHYEPTITPTHILTSNQKRALPQNHSL